MDRAIAPNEAAVVRWLLDHAPVGDVAPYRIPPVEELRVLEGCDCGCASLDFQEDAWGGAAIIADAFAGYPDGQRAGLILWGREGEIVLLEIYDHQHPGTSHRFPVIADLRSYQEHGWG
ncbi:MAG: hypothetical protein P4L56_21830 [Candidatus Sulfopaludibacter sp.]|nr:hypothetical protein [Candidatus Sulfopaludibacter sp.]